MQATEAVMCPDAEKSARGRAGRKRVLYGLWAAGIVALYVLHFPHLLADFPNYSPWMDYSKYTDEGWYAGAAVRYWLTGHWFLRGDFNAGVALPAWPLLLAGVFKFTGVSLGAARVLGLGIFGINLLLSFAVVRARAPRWAALLAVTILAANPFLYAFSRLALLEPLLICLLLLSWWVALRLPQAGPGVRRALLAGLGVLLVAMVLTKTTAIFLLPSTVYMLVAACGFRRREALRDVALAGATAAVLWCAWYFLLVHPHYRVDYQYLFDANQWPQPTTPGGWLAAFWYALHGSLWISPVLCGAAVAGLMVAGFSPRWRLATGLWANPVPPASLLAVGGYVFFIGWHNNPQPRYYEVVAYPLAFLTALGTADLLRRGRPLLLRVAGGAVCAATVGACCSGVWMIAGYLRHPEYTWHNAVRNLTRYIDKHPAPNRLLLSISGADISLMTHLPSICDDYGTWDLPYRVHVYEPAWYAAWNEIDPGTLADLETQYSLEEAARFPAFDDPDRNLLILYRLRSLPPEQQKYEAKEEAADNAGK